MQPLIQVSLQSLRELTFGAFLNGSNLCLSELCVRPFVYLSNVIIESEQIATQPWDNMSVGRLTPSQQKSPRLNFAPSGNFKYFIFLLS